MSPTIKRLRFLWDNMSQRIGRFAQSSAPELSDDIKDLLSEVAANKEVCQKIIGSVDSALATAHKRRWLNRPISIGFVLADLSLFAILYYTPLAFGVSADTSTLISYLGCPCVIIVWQYFGLRKLELWLAGQGEAYVAGLIFGALELGIWYFSEYESMSPAQHRQIKDVLAIRIQRVASACFAVYRETKSTRFFKSQVRLQAKHSQ